MRIPDLSTQLFHVLERSRVLRRDEYAYRSAGWLGDRVPREGTTDADVRERLRALRRLNPVPDPCVLAHACEICERTLHGPEVDRSVKRLRAPLGRGQFLVPDGRTRYVLPNLVLHYIERHAYRLPDVVEDAVRRCALEPLPEIREAQAAGAPRRG